MILNHGGIKTETFSEVHDQNTNTRGILGKSYQY